MNDHDTAEHETDHAKKLHDLVQGQRFVMLTSADESGQLVSRPMTIQEIEDPWIIRFITQRDTDVARQSEGQQVNLAIMTSSDYVSLSGVGVISGDLEAKRELWNRLNEAYAGEPEDPNNVILDIAVESGEYWDGGSPITRVLGLAKAAATGEAPTSGDHGTAQL